MTVAEFDNTRWYKGMLVKCKRLNDELRYIISVDFDEMLIGVDVNWHPDDPYDPMKEKDLIWMRCENCELVSLDN